MCSRQKAGVTPDCHMMGILLREAAARLDYEYLTALMKVRFPSDFKFDSCRISNLDSRQISNLILVGFQIQVCDSLSDFKFKKWIQFFLLRCRR